MYKTKFIISISIFITFLVFTSVVKNKTRILEKKISYFKAEIFIKKKDFNEAQLDFYYLTSPAEIEKKLNMIGFKNYQPIEYSKIFFNISEFIVAVMLPFFVSVISTFFDNWSWTSFDISSIVSFSEHEIKKRIEKIVSFLEISDIILAH